MATITDTGIGISYDEIPHVFDKFYRVEGGTNENGEGAGTGLGLAIAKALVEAQGGHIWVKSTLGKGTTFYFTLPILVVHEEEDESLGAQRADADAVMAVRPKRPARSGRDIDDLPPGHMQVHRP